MGRRLSRPAWSTLLLVLTLAVPALAQDRVTTPEERFGHQLGADYELVNYQELHDYWITLAGQSDRMVLDTIGTTEEGRPQIQAIITSPENHANIDRYRDIARRLAKVGDLTEEDARGLAEEGKAVVWIDGGLHASEVLGAQQLAEMVYRLNDYTDDETLRILDDVIILATHANPDGHDLYANWYMRHDDPLERTTSGVPVLYQKYAGHDNNRDFYMAALEETRNMNRSMYREWFPQIVYNHHQTGPAGTVMFAPPFRDPPNHYLDGMILTSLDQVGSAMHHRFVREDKGGTTMRSGAPYSTWWNGGLRTTPYFKNMIGLLTETIGHPTPIDIPFVPRTQLPSADYPLPVEPGPWHFRQSVEYSQTANWAVLDYASRNSDLLLFNIWRMGKNSVERGSRDSWTTLPFEIDEAAEEMDRGTRADWARYLRDPEDREPRGFIIPSSQVDFPTATKFVNSLLYNGVDVHRAAEAFTVQGQRYPAGSYIVKADQAFRPHVLDMFEEQQHPNDFAYPGAPPTAPYDNTGWTLAWQMGIEFDRVLEGFDGPFELIPDVIDTPPAGTIAGPTDASGYLVAHINDAFTAVNRVLGSDGSAWWYTDEVRAEGTTFDVGAFYLDTDRATVERLAEEKGLDFVGVSGRPAGPAVELGPVKIGLWDRYGGSMPSGWTRMILEDFEFDFDVLYPPDLDEDDLSEYDVLLFEDGAIPAEDRNGDLGGIDPESIPEEYRDRIGRLTVETTVPRILDFVREGGAAIAIGSSANLAYHAGLPVENHLVRDGEPLTREEYFTPGSILDMRVDHTSPVTHGYGERVNVLFSHSPTFSIEAGAEEVRRIGWYDTPTPLKSGWAWGQEYLENGVGAFEADYGDGQIFVFGPKITFRSQSHGTFGFLFNGIYYGALNGVTERR
ncbi:MAG: M14 metallopeptidase family protein [Gemmatimonadota bacterium]|nr:M14 metallopeptidase family protein [Gemmatimonadota bacterium]